MTNKQVKILNNKVNQVTTEIEELSKSCNTRLELLARNDPLYQNYQGQLAEKQKRIADYQDFIQMINGEDQNVKRTPTQDSGPTKPKRGERKPTKPT